MSALTFERKPFATDGHLQVLVKSILSASVAQARQYTQLKELPDHLLLDIGVDPRSAPVSLQEAIARPDYAHGGVVLAHARTVARS